MSFLMIYEMVESGNLFFRIIFWESDIEDYIDESFVARISELFQDREIFVRALDETEGASSYAPQELDSDMKRCLVIFVVFSYI